jgi:bleomycin hydrolase
VVPQSVYPESTHSSSSGSLNKLLKTKLREHALVLRDLSSRLRSSGQLSGGDIIAALRSKKEELLSEIYGVMSATLGVPPQPNDKLVWDYYDKDGKAGRWEGSAKQFYAVRRKCFLSCRVRRSSWLTYLGILEQELSSFRRFLSNQ